MDKVTLTLTKDELERITRAINYYNVAVWHKDIDKARQDGNEFAVKYFEEKWLADVDLFCKLNDYKKEA